MQRPHSGIPQIPRWTQYSLFPQPALHLEPEKLVAPATAGAGVLSAGIGFLGDGFVGLVRWGHLIAGLPRAGAPAGVRIRIYALPADVAEVGAAGWAGHVIAGGHEFKASLAGVSWTVLVVFAAYQSRERLFAGLNLRAWIAVVLDLGVHRKSILRN
ncbi:hypothetical protein LTR29_013040 [Friedmanniomyces endolithicus]|nr:hypothetical protein LTR29_013040 [Friedmanniomyces endolithicus]